MTRFVKNTCEYTNFFHFLNCFNNWRNFGLYWNISLFQTCSNLSSNFFTQKGVVAKPFEPELWNCAWKNHRSCAFRRYKAKFLNINALPTIKVPFVAVVIDCRVAFSVIHKIVAKATRNSSGISNSCTVTPALADPVREICLRPDWQSWFLHEKSLHFPYS